MPFFTRFKKPTNKSDTEDPPQIESPAESIKGFAYVLCALDELAENKMTKDNRITLRELLNEIKLTLNQAEKSKQILDKTYYSALQNETPMHVTSAQKSLNSSMQFLSKVDGDIAKFKNSSDSSGSQFQEMFASLDARLASGPNAYLTPDIINKYISSESKYVAKLVADGFPEIGDMLIYYVNVKSKAKWGENEEEAPKLIQLGMLHEIFEIKLNAMSLLSKAMERVLHVSAAAADMQRSERQ